MAQTQGRLFVLERPENVLGPKSRAKIFGKVSLKQDTGCSGDNITGKITAATILTEKRTERMLGKNRIFPELRQNFVELTTLEKDWLYLTFCKETND